MTVTVTVTALSHQVLLSPGTDHHSTQILAATGRIGSASGRLLSFPPGGEMILRTGLCRFPLLSGSRLPLQAHHGIPNAGKGACTEGRVRSSGPGPSSCKPGSCVPGRHLELQVSGMTCANAFVEVEMVHLLQYYSDGQGSGWQVNTSGTRGFLL